MRFFALSWALAALPLAAQDEPVGKKAIEINAKGWINSEALSLAKCKGKVVALEFWATW